MNIKFAIFAAAYALLSIGPVIAAEQPEYDPEADSIIAAEQTAPNPVSSFGSGFNVGPGGGSASSLAGGFGSPISSSGNGSQTFGGGFTGTGPLSTPGAGTGSGSPGL